MLRVVVCAAVVVAAAGCGAAPGSPQAPGTVTATVTVTAAPSISPSGVESGPERVDEVPVPDVTGMTEDEARAVLEPHGWWRVVTEPALTPDGGMRAGLVQRTDPPAGTLTVRGAVLTLRLNGD